jgi:uncharacterized membrane protein YfcA
MKKIFIIMLTSLVYNAFSQDTSDISELRYFSSADKAKVYLNNDSVINGSLMSIQNNMLVIRSNVMNERAISIDNIQMIKVKRQSFWMGFAAGALAGYFGGYGVGYVTYKAKGLDDDDRDRRGHSIVSGFVTAAPTSLLGGLIGALVIKKKFIINGNRNKMLKLHSALL